jgi:peptidyl-prolyl cis-trans isomerase C
MNLRSFIVALATVLLASSLQAENKTKPAPQPAPAPAASGPDEVVARVNGKDIKRKELDAAAQGYLAQLAQRGQRVPPEQFPRIEYDLLDQLISRELILQEGRSTKITNLDEQVKLQLSTVKKQAGGDEAFASALKDGGLTEQDYAGRVRDSIIVRETIQKVVDSKVHITPEQVKSFYDQNRDKFVQPEQARASHILIRVPADASDKIKAEKHAQMELIRTRLKQGEKFADVAKAVSEDPGSAQNGGDLGYFGRGAMVPEFDLAVFSLKTNELSDIITTPFGYHVLIVTNRKPKHEVPFDEVKAEIEPYLKNQKGGEIAQQHVKDLRKTAQVEVLMKAPPVTTPAPSGSAPVVETPPVAAPTTKPDPKKP